MVPPNFSAFAESVNEHDLFTLTHDGVRNRNAEFGKIRLFFHGPKVAKPPLGVYLSPETRMNFWVYSDEYFMREALKEARYAYEKDEVPVGAVVVCDKRIIARAHNLTETLNDVTAHAEMQAITAAANYLGGKYLRDCTVYVTVEPCVMCAGALKWSQVSRVVYGTADEKAGAGTVGKSLYHPKTRVEYGLLEQECRELMQEFFRAKRR